MISILNQLISKIKGEPFHLDMNISIGYMFSFLFVKSLSMVRGVLLFRQLKRVFVGKHSTVLCAHKISYQNNLNIDRDCYIDALSHEGIQIGNNVSIQKRVIIECTGSLKELGIGLKMGNNVGIGSSSFLGCAGGIEIGNDTIIGNFVSFHSENHNTQDVKTPIRLQGVNRQGIVIGKNCWIGAKVTILDGVVLGDGCIVAAGAVVKLI